MVRTCTFRSREPFMSISISEFCQLYHLDRKCSCPLLEGSSPTTQQTAAHQQSKVLLTGVVGSGNPRQTRKRLLDCWRLAKTSACCCRYMDRPTVCHAGRTAPRNFHFSGPNRKLFLLLGWSLSCCCSSNRRFFSFSSSFCCSVTSSHSFIPSLRD